MVDLSEPMKDLNYWRMSTTATLWMHIGLMDNSEVQVVLSEFLYDQIGVALSLMEQLCTTPNKYVLRSPISGRGRGRKSYLGET